MTSVGLLLIQQSNLPALGSVGWFKGCDFKSDLSRLFKVTLNRSDQLQDRGVLNAGAFRNSQGRHDQCAILGTFNGYHLVVHYFLSRMTKALTMSGEGHTYGGRSMENAAHQFADFLTEWRSFGQCTGIDLLKQSAHAQDVSVEAVITRAADLMRSTNAMFDELERLGEPVEHITSAKNDWTRAILGGRGWSADYHDADDIIPPHSLALLRAFAIQYDLATRTRRPNPEAINRIIVEFGPIRDFIEAEGISEEMKRLLLLKIDSVEALLQEATTDFTPVISKMAEILGMFMLIGSSIPDPERQQRWADKAKSWAANFGSNLTINMMSGITSAAALQQLGM